MIKNNTDIGTHLNNKFLSCFKKIKHEKTAQDIMPVQDIDNSTVYMKDKEFLKVLKLQPINISLFSLEEKAAQIMKLSRQFNSVCEPMQIFCIGRPVDLSEYLNLLHMRIKGEKNFTKKTVLKKYFNYAAGISARGEMTERMFYIVIRKNDLKELEELAQEIIYKFSSAGLKCDICGENELLDLYCLFAYPMQAYYEKNEKEYLDLTSIMYYDTEVKNGEYS